MIQPIHTEADHDRALSRIAVLMSAAPGTLEFDELDMLATLADAWEAKHHSIDPPDPIAAILFRIDQQGLSRKDLEGMIGSRARVSEILTRKRSLTLPMIRRLSSELGISADLLISQPAQPHQSRPSVPTREARKLSRTA